VIAEVAAGLEHANGRRPVQPCSGSGQEFSGK
jgi:hypothetical protein